MELSEGQRNAVKIKCQSETGARVAGGWVLSEGVKGPAVTGPGFLLLIKKGVTSDIVSLAIRPEFVYE
jgi:hypothetical protein